MARLLELGSRGGDVSELQRQLRGLGFSVPGSVDGLFEVRTRDALEQFQRACRLVPDGRAGPRTMAALAAESTAQLLPELASYRGHFAFLLAEEGWRGFPYWPGGESGVTLDPGFDLGRQTRERTQNLYGRTLSAADLAVVQLAVGVRGTAAQELVRSPAFRAVRIDRPAAAALLPRIACPYWLECLAACPQLLRPSAPASSHSATLSLGYNCGADAVRALRPAAERGDWLAVAALIEQTPSPTPAHAERRMREAALLRAGLRD